MTTHAERAMRLRGVRVHNLKNIDLDLPLEQLVVVTGVSGSGKSSLAFDTLAAEGQRRYIESFSTHARQFLARIEKPDADRIDNVPPAIAIRQKAGVRSRRSTVATATEIHDFLRLLYARVGTIVCPTCGVVVRRDTPASVQAEIETLAAGTRFMIVFPYRVEPRDEAHAARALQEAGFTRAIIAGQTIAFDGSGATPNSRGDWLIVVDRLVAGKESPERLADSVELAFEFGEGRCIVLSRTSEDASAADRETIADAVRIDDQWWEALRFDERLTCGRCGREFSDLEPRLFSFNSPLGACKECQGIGLVRMPATAGQRSAWSMCPACHGARLQPDALAVDVAGANIADLCRRTIRETGQFFAEISATSLDRRMALPGRPSAGGQLPTADGPEGPSYDTGGSAAASVIIPQIVARLGFLEQVGLGYLTLDRAMSTLSTGEAQRVLLTAALGSQLVNALFVLDEPTVGLHPRDTERLIAAIERLRDRGNSVVLVEHDAAVMHRADRLIDIGPGAGREGGQVVFNGPPAEIADSVNSATARALAHAVDSSPTGIAQRATPSGWLTLSGVRHHNLADVTARFPLGVLCVVTGVSGSGKSSLVQETLYPALVTHLEHRTASAKPRQSASKTKTTGEGDGEHTLRPVDPALELVAPGDFDRLDGWEQLDAVMLVDQRPIGRSPRANPATYLTVFGEIRALFAGTAEAKVRNLSAGQFSFNTAAGGRCPTCEGNGVLAVDLQFLPDVTMTCPDCRGTRYRRDLLDVKYRGLNIAEVLGLTIREAFPFFRGRSKLQRRLKHAKDVGLDYLTLGQPANTLSGGESQRLKLAAHLARGTRARTLFLLDEPTTGLHPADVVRLLDCLRSLLVAGHSLIVIEHNLDLIRAADYVIDLGPDAGPEGGRIIAAGTPEEIAASPQSVTVRYL